MVEPLLPLSNNRCGRWRDHRQAINGIIRRLAPAASGVSCPNASARGHKRHLLWPADVAWEWLLQRVQAAADTAGDTDSSSGSDHDRRNTAYRRSPGLQPAVRDKHEVSRRSTISAEVIRARPAWAFRTSRTQTRDLQLHNAQRSMTQTKVPGLLAIQVCGQA
ncbi:hypothetical protein GCM10010507_20130 [Streptomyces cinnamoneus]|uniref:Uncharacterized protein n=1 Tax=Streptomyces cinnamoneus TaxID=53446 RepID=A0A918TEA3_STRCJ|nr:hypothetical protein GCM10010507_20130 [Streptomyces cinnamoneus]